MTIITEEKNYRELKESMRMMKGQEDKRIDIDQVTKYKTYVILLFKVQKITENMNPVISKTINARTMIL